LVRKFFPGSGSTFFDPADFPWVAEVEAQFEPIRGEVDGLLGRVERLPGFQDLDPRQVVLTDDDQWKTYPLVVFGQRQAEAERTCPATLRALERVPRLENAMFSIFAAGKEIPPHGGPTKSLLRFHLATKVPEPTDQCGIRVGSDIRHWEEGRSLVFDDTHDHEAWNRTDDFRVVLFVDFVRPSPRPWAPATWLSVRIARQSQAARDVRAQISRMAGTDGPTP
jgi:beta-hydroxylase